MVFGWVFEFVGFDYGGYINVVKGGYLVVGLMVNWFEF